MDFRGAGAKLAQPDDSIEDVRTTSNGREEDLADCLSVQETHGLLKGCFLCFTGRSFCFRKCLSVRRVALHGCADRSEGI